MGTATNNNKILLKNGLLVDGTGNPPRKADVLMERGRLSVLQPGDTMIDASPIDCDGKVIAPGFIDVHSHMDYFAIENAPEHFDPFIAQGITTMVVGNCGFSPFGFKCNTPHQHLIENSLFKEGHGDISWHSFKGYQQRIQKHGCGPNLVSLVGHGVCRTSLNGFSASPLSSEQQAEMLSLLDEALCQGAAGVSLGLQYKPGVFAGNEELKAVARLVKQHDKVLTVHAKAYSSLSGTYPMNPFGKAHNLRAIDEMLDLARETDVRLQFSHLIFVGESTWKTLDEAIAKFDRAIADGVDVKFDMFPYPFGATLLNTLLPEWVMARMPGVLKQSLPLLRLRLEAWLAFRSLGLGYDCIQISEAGCPAYQPYNGLFLTDIAERVGLSPFQVMVDILDQSRAEARMIMHKYYGPEIIERLMTHPAALFMTDSWPEPSGVENAATYGAFPRFLQMARETGKIPMETLIHRMTAQAAERFGIADRGIIKDGYVADVVVLDWEQVRDNTTREYSDAAPDGIEHVFINGVPARLNGEKYTAPVSGECVAMTA